MNTIDTGLAEVSLRKIAALLGAVALSTAVLSGCGGGSSAEGNTTGTSSEQTSEQATGNSEKSSSADLPGGFPDDVPLPEFTSVTNLAGESDEMSHILLELKNPTDTPVEDYAAQLTAAGYTVPPASVAANAGNAKGPKWEILFLTSAENSLTVSVMSNQ